MHIRSIAREAVCDVLVRTNETMGSRGELSPANGSHRSARRAVNFVRSAPIKVVPLPRKLSSTTWTNCPGLNCVYSGSGSLLTTRKGFLDYENLDLKAYRAERLKVFVAMLGFFGLTRPLLRPT